MFCNKPSSFKLLVLKVYCGYLEDPNENISILNNSHMPDKYYLDAVFIDRTGILDGDFCNIDISIEEKIMCPLVSHHEGKAIQINIYLAFVTNRCSKWLTMSSSLFSFYLHNYPAR